MRNALRELIFGVLTDAIGAGGRVWLEDRPQRTTRRYVVFDVQMAPGVDGTAPVRDVALQVTCVGESAEAAATLSAAAAGALDGYSGATTNVSLLELATTGSDSDYNKEAGHWWASLRLQGIAIG